MPVAQVNRLNLTYSFDLDHYFVGGEDVRPERSHVYHVSFPSHWNTQSLCQLFSPYGSIQVTWINETSAFVGLKDAAKARSLNKSLAVGAASDAESGVRITPYYEFRSRKEEEVTSNSAKRSLDQVAAEARTAELMDERRRKVESTPQDSGKRVRRSDKSKKSSLETSLPDEQRC